MASLQDTMTPAFEGPCMHEALFDDSFLKDTGVSALDFAKAMIDEGYHPMTTYFPLVVHGAMLIEPTESQAKEDLDLFIVARCARWPSARRAEPRPRTSRPLRVSPRGVVSTRRLPRASPCYAGVRRTIRRKAIR